MFCLHGLARRTYTIASPLVPLCQVNVERVMKALKENGEKGKQLILAAVPLIAQEAGWTDTIRDLQVRLHAIRLSYYLWLVCPSILTILLNPPPFRNWSRPRSCYHSYTYMHTGFVSLAIMIHSNLWCLAIMRSTGLVTYHILRLCSTRHCHERNYESMTHYTCRFFKLEYF